MPASASELPPAGADRDPHPTGPERGRRRPLRVVVADDDASTRALLEALLSMSPELEVVGTCTDGVEAVETAVARDAEVIVLDLNMPRLDGLAASRFLQTALPASLQVLFTSEPHGEAAARAAELDVHVLDKFASDELVPLLEREARAAARRPRGAGSVDGLVLAALEGNREDAVLVVGADGSVLYYDVAAAVMLELPFPPDRGAELERICGALRLVERDGTPRRPETRPLLVALATGKPVTDEVCTLRDGTIDVYRTRAMPFHDKNGNLIGAAVYWTHVERLPAG